MSQIAELIKRVEGLTGPDREMDVMVVYAFFPDIGPYNGQCIGDEPIFWHEPYRKQPCPEFTASLDAVVALIERVRPGWGYAVRKKSIDPVSYDAGVASPYYWTGEGVEVDANADASTPALALLLALLRSMEADRG